MQKHTSLIQAHPNASHKCLLVAPPPLRPSRCPLPAASVPPLCSGVGLHGSTALLLLHARGAAGSAPALPLLGWPSRLRPNAAVWDLMNQAAASETPQHQQPPRQAQGQGQCHSRPATASPLLCYRPSCRQLVSCAPPCRALRNY